MSFGNMQYQRNFQQQEQQQQQQQQQQHPHLHSHPLLSAISGHNYAQTQRLHYPYHHYYQQQQQHPHYHYHHGRPLIAAGSSYNGAYANPHSGYGIEPSVEYEIEHTAPSGSYSSYHPTAGSAPAYPPPHQPPHPPMPPPHMPKAASSSSGKKTKKSSNSVMSALTLLSFFFFVNMLQNCIKDHMADMNPTVMVLTASGSRNRFNKLAEMNSREQTSSPASTIASQQAQAEAAASNWQEQQQSVSSVPVIVTPTVVLQSPYSSGLVTNKPIDHHKPPTPSQSHTHHYQQYNDDDYNYGHRTPPASYSHSNDFYPNRTHIDQYHPHYPTLSRPSSIGSNSDSNSNPDYYQHHYYPDRHHYMDAGYDSNSNSNSNSNSGYSNRRHPWSYGANSYAGNQQRYSSAPWSSASLGAQSGVSSYLDNVRSRQQGDDGDFHVNDDDDDDVLVDVDDDQRRRSADAFYTRIN